MRSGPRRHLVTFQKSTQAQDTFGEPIETWADYTQAWANVSPLVGNERFTAQQVNASMDTVFRLNYISGLDTKMRISWSSKVYNIHSIVNVEEKNRDLMIYAELQL